MDKEEREEKPGLSLITKIFFLTFVTWMVFPLDMMLKYEYWGVLWEFATIWATCGFMLTLHHYWSRDAF
jgi:hypothetical protein